MSDATTETVIVDFDLDRTLSPPTFMDGWDLVPSHPYTPYSYNNTLTFGHNRTASLIFSSFAGIISVAVFGINPFEGPRDFTVEKSSSQGRQRVSYSYSSVAFGESIFSDEWPQADDEETRIEFHEITPYIDYMLYTVKHPFDLRGTTIHVDDSSSEIIWNGWTSDFAYASSPSFSPIIGNFVPHGNGTHSSKSVGDSFTFQFAGILGTSILVAGLDPTLTNCLDCQLVMTFDLDSHSITRHFQPTGSALIPHFTYFSVGSLEPGNHTLTATITDVEGDIAAYIDYLTYTPSFDTLLDKPVFSQLPSNTEQPAPTSSNPGTSESIHASAIAGAVVGGFITLVLLGLGGIFLYRKRWSLQGHRPTSFSLALSGYVVEPFTLHHPIHPESMKGYISPALGFEEHWREGKSGRAFIADPVLIPTEAQEELRQRRDALAQGIETLETRSVRAEGDSSDSGEQENIRDVIREMRAQMNAISRDISLYVVPPAYGTETIRDA
ncbi:hypothetical protein VKT23_011238 [Stygiomarasmius scandens]|uniref:Uncharacterized protein n=1 Tax=Marasmiellus scandens TaxID=2682957 RepID=A0ABR1JC99_9AGAR